MIMRNRTLAVAGFICLMLGPTVSPPAFAQTSSVEDDTTVILVAAPNLVEPAYRRTVLIATAIEGGRHIGIIVNRPTRNSLSSLFPDHGPSKAVAEPVFFGGPMSRSAVFALAKSTQGTGVGSIPLMKNLYLAITVNVVDKVIEETPNEARYYVGNVLWRPGELQQEVRRGVWHVLNANPDIVFTKDPEHLWEELSRMTRGIVAQVDSMPSVLYPH